MLENFKGLNVSPVTPRHLVPETGESIDDYATRVANRLVVNGDDVLGGSSYGGLIASTIARQRPVQRVVHISSISGFAGLNVDEGAMLARLIPAWFFDRCCVLIACCKRFSLRRVLN